MDFLSTPVGPLSIGQWAGAVAAFLVVSSLFSSMRQKTEQAKGSAGSPARCLGCGWEGKVSRYHRTCPRCGNSITRLAKGEG